MTLKCIFNMVVFKLSGKEDVKNVFLILKISLLLIFFLLLLKINTARNNPFNLRLKVLWYYPRPLPPCPFNVYDTTHVGSVENYNILSLSMLVKLFKGDKKSILVNFGHTVPCFGAIVFLNKLLDLKFLICLKLVGIRRQNAHL